MMIAMGMRCKHCGGLAALGAWRRRRELRACIVAVDAVTGTNAGLQDEHDERGESGRRADGEFILDELVDDGE